MAVTVETRGPVCTVILDRPAARNAVDGTTARALYDAFRAFDADVDLKVAVLWGAGGTFCAGADLKAISGGAADVNPLEIDMKEVAPMGPSRLLLSKPVIAAVSGYAVAGGLELACWCDLRVAEEDAVFGVFCRRFGVPLIDGGTQRLARIVGMGRALDMILTGRPVGAQEALAFGLANRVVEKGRARPEAELLAETIAAFPQACMRSDREALYGGLGMGMTEALALEFELGVRVLAGGEAIEGAKRFAGGQGRHGGS